MPRLGNGYDHDDKFKQRDRKQCLGSFFFAVSFVLLYFFIMFLPAACTWTYVTALTTSATAAPREEER